ncbi:MAG: hypothetical protein B7X39_07245 [Lysobacterales bacterium 14-68-21]|nr:MAG: hypothetical protein B7X45_07590 [Xanthomonadales bacterium 15-68-25]OZB67130.1 MAG: hypothetical protein B7X39_07245 [Xanthomonadales bacterium 14-68-21]
MELDEMKLAWQALDQRLAKQQALNLRLLRDQGMDRLRRGLRPLVWGQSVQLAFGVAFMLFGIDFWATHPERLHTVAWGVSVQLFGMLMVLSSGRVLHLVQQVDYGLPVLDIQQRLARLRAWRVRVEAPVFSVVGAVVWIPLVLILIQRGWDEMQGRPAYFLDRPEFAGVLPHLFLGALASLLLVGLAYVLLRRFGRLRWLHDQFAGSAVRRAESELEAIARFERE